MKRNDEEHRAQSALFQWAGYATCTWPELRFMHAVPNGGDRHPAVGAKMKREGVKRGVPDVFLDVPRGPYHGLRIEMKSKKGSESEEQKAYIKHLREQGYRVEVCRSFEEARDVVIQYLEGETWHSEDS